ncbi:flagellar protein FlhE [Pseudomonas cichorii]|uniref:flagellar protein FlhE n=1 Tax=Pseudomonas cichorii TaxID=36746 RepID=UPI000EFF8513|nr:flagellar protein FlhE [Pseudomonas cichorii]
MKFDYKKSKWIRSASGIVLAFSGYSEMAMAGSYQSSVNLPTVHSRGYLYTANIPLRGAPPEGAWIKNVSWNWNVTGWPRGLEVELCQANNCIDISRMRVGSTQVFRGQLANRCFYYSIKVSGAGTVPVAGQFGRITVDW